MRAIIFATAFSVLSVHAQTDDIRTLTVPYSNAAVTTIGSGIDVDLVNQSRFTCLDIGPADARWLDGSGAVSTTASLELVSNYASLAKSLDLEVDYKSKADVSLAVIKAGGSMNLNVKYEDFAKDESHTTVILLKAASDFGRYGLSNYKLNEGFAKLLSEGELAEFRKRCGTHTVVAEQRQAMVAAVVTISDLTSSSKRSIEGLFKTTFSGGATIELVTASVESEKSLRWKNIIETAKKVGTVRVSYEARGGAGISDATKLLATSNPADLEALLKGIAEVGSGFSQATSAPKGYLLVPNTVFGATFKVADADKLTALNKYFLVLARLDFATDRVVGYKSSFLEVYNKFYVSVLKDLGLKRFKLVNIIEKCVLEDDCPSLAAEELGILFLEDVISSESFKLDCGYTAYTSTDSNGRGTRANVLSSISVNLRGRIRLATYVSIDTALINRFGPDVKSIQIIPQFAAYSTTKPDASGTSRISATVDYKSLHPEVETSNGNVYVRNLDELTRQRDNLQNSIYGIAIQAKNGLSILNTIGPPFGGECATVKQVQF